MPPDELTFATWKRESPHGRVLRPDERVAAAGNYAAADWEEEVARMPVAVASNLDDALAPRDIVIGVSIDGVAKAYPLAALQRQSPVMDTIGGTPLLIVFADDKQSVRAFERIVDGRRLEFFAETDPSTRLVDAETGSDWDFTGTATGGPLKGKQLRKVAVLKDYWFDWKIYNPRTALYTLGAL